MSQAQDRNVEMGQTVKISMNVDSEDWAELKEFARAHNMTMTQFVQSALGTEKYLRERVEDGANLVLEKDAKRTEVVFR